MEPVYITKPITYDKAIEILKWYGLIYQIEIGGRWVKIVTKYLSYPEAIDYTFYFQHSHIGNTDFGFNSTDQLI